MLSTDKCPKCGYISDIVFEECPKCGVIIKKIIEIQKRCESKKILTPSESPNFRKKIKSYLNNVNAILIILSCVFTIILTITFSIQSGDIKTQKGEAQKTQLASKISPTNFSRNDRLRYWCDKGDAFYDTGDFWEAIKAYKKALEISPYNYAVYNDMGSCYNNLGLHQRAVESYHVAIKLSLKLETTFPKAWYNLGIAYLRQGKPHEACVAFEEACKSGIGCETLNNIINQGLCR